MIERRNPPVETVIGRNRAAKYDDLCRAAISNQGEWVVETSFAPDTTPKNTSTMIRGTLLKHLMAVEIRVHDGDVYLRLAPKASR